MVFRITSGMGCSLSRKEECELLYYKEQKKIIGWKGIVSQRGRHCINLSVETGPFARKRVGIMADKTWCVFVRASLHMRRAEKPTRCHVMVSCTYNMLNMFRALLCPSSEARDCMCVITAYGVQCLGCWLLEVRCRTAGYAFGNA